MAISENTALIAIIIFLSFFLLDMRRNPMGKLENKFQSELIKEIKQKFPGSMVLKNDPNYIQGIPDLLVMHKKKWAALECKKADGAHHQPNQDYYVDMMNKMSFCRFVSPENKEEVLNELKVHFQ